MIKNYLNKIKYIVIEEGVFNFVIRTFRLIIYKARRFVANDNIDFESWQLLNRKYHGQRVFLIGNGPSLNKTPLHLLKNETTFCMNRFNLMFDRLTWRPDMYGISDDVVIVDMLDEINTIKKEVEYFFLPDIHPSAPINVNYKKLIDDHEKIHWFHPDKIGFSNQLPALGINKTITNVAIQILVYLGFKEIYLVGVDLDYQVQKSTDNLDNRHLRAESDDDPNHFDPRYFGTGRKYHIPRMEETLEKFKEAKKFCSQNNVAVFNATVGGKLEVFQRVNFRDLFTYSKNNELNLLLDKSILKYNEGERFIEAFPEANIVNKFEDIDEKHECTIVPVNFGAKLIPKYVLSHLILGPFNNEYLFIKR